MPAKSRYWKQTFNIRGTVAKLASLGLVVQVTNGKGQMPAWKNTLEDEEIKAVAEYVFATAGADAW